MVPKRRPKTDPPATSAADDLVALAWRTLNVAEVLRIALDVEPEDWIECQALTNELFAHVQRLLFGVSGALAHEVVLMRARRDIRSVQVALSGGGSPRDLVPDVGALIDHLGVVLKVLQRGADLPSPQARGDLFEARKSAWRSRSRTLGVLFP